MQSLQANPRQIICLSGDANALIIDAILNFWWIFFYNYPDKFASLADGNMR